MSAYVVSGSYLSDIADAIRAKTGTIDTMTIDEMPQKITDISGANFDNVNVTAADVLAPKVFIDKDGNEQSGTMPTNNLVTPSVSFDNGVFTSTVTQATGYVEESTTSNSLIIPDSWVELNFKIVGNTTQPASPTENTIWVNTDTGISRWVFSDTEPETPGEGTVWIETWVYSGAAFNALSQNGAMLNPIRAWQYIAGAWVSKEMQIYQAGAWQDSRIYLFDKGELCSKVTGGWSSSGVTYSGYTVKAASYGEDIVMATGSGSSQMPLACTERTVNLTNVEKLSVNVKSVTHTNRCLMGITKTKTNLNTSAAAVVLLNAAGVTSMDVSAMSGEYFVYVYASSTGSTTNVTLTVSEIYLEV